MSYVKRIVEDVVKEVSRVVLGHERDITYITLAIIMGGHVLIYGPPGAAKTLTSEAIAHVLGLKFKRISFTPDILPSDIIGAKIIDPKTAELRTVKGPIFANLVLADEINRGNPKSLSALLEAMQEGKVSIEGDVYELPKPFSVIATLNPIETQGIFPLPIAVLDRFMLSLKFDYPSREVEEAVLLSDRLVSTYDLLSKLRVVVNDVSEISKAIREIEHVFVDKDVLDYILDIVTRVRSDSRVFSGPSPRAAQHLLRISRSLALVDGRDYVIPDDVKEASIITLRHRLVIRGSTGSILDDLRISEKIIEDVLRSIKPPL